MTIAYDPQYEKAREAAIREISDSLVATVKKATEDHPEDQRERMEFLKLLMPGANIAD